MKSTGNLRWRVSVGFLVTGAVISGLFALLIRFVSHDMETRFIEATLGEQLRYTVEHMERSASVSLPASPNLQGYVAAAGEDGTLPPYLRELSPGTYERWHEGHEFHIMIQDVGPRRYYLSLDATRMEPYEAGLDKMLVAGSILFALLSWWLGYWLSGRIIAPVTELSRQVQKSRADDEHALDLAAFAGDEVGELARIFNDHMGKLKAFAQREAAFTADVSHEYRNYLAVMDSTVDVLLSRRQSDEELAERLDRLRRAISEMEELTEVFLILAREPPPSEGEAEVASPVEPVLREVIAKRRADLERKNIQVSVTVANGIEARAPPAAIAATLGSLLDNAIMYAAGDEIAMTLDENGVTVTATGSDDVRANEAAWPRQRGPTSPETIGRESLGLAIARRLCERYDWSIEVLGASGNGAQMRVVFAP